MPKIILVSYSGHEQDSAALDHAFNLAETYDARVEAWHTVLDPQAIIFPYAAYGMPVYPESCILEMEKINEKSRKEAEARFRQKAGERKLENCSFHSAIGNTADILSARARVCDLVVMPRTDENVNFTNAATGILFGSGKPVLLVPPGEKTKKFDGKVLIAWNGSREAGHAVASSLPYLAHSKVSILSKKEGKKDAASAEDLKAYLKDHGIDAEILSNMDGGSPLGAAILNTARMMDASLIVMGAWGHSRIREYILGGVTEYMLHNADCPVFMAH